jgi:uncharacterized protein (TIGR03382 family)
MSLRALALASLLSCPALAQRLDILELPSPDGGPAPSTYAQTVSADGKTVAGSLDDNNGGTLILKAVRRDGGMVTSNLGDLPGGLVFSIGNALSADGTILYGTGFAEDFEGGRVDGLQVAFRVERDGGFTILGDLPGGELKALANACSADGTVAVGASYDSTNQFIATRFTDAQVVGLGTFVSSSPASLGVAVTSDGRRILGSSPKGIPNASTRTFFVDLDDAGVPGPLKDLGDLPGGSDTVFAGDISGDGRFVVGSASSSASGPDYVEAYRAVILGGAVVSFNPLGGLADPDGGAPVSSDALAVSADGQVVVGRSVVDINENEEAFVWSSTYGLERLSQAARRAGLSQASLNGFVFGQARDISADGLTIVGNGFVADGGGVRAFVLTLPPGSFDEPVPDAGVDAGAGGNDGGSGGGSGAGGGNGTGGSGTGGTGGSGTGGSGTGGSGTGGSGTGGSGGGTGASDAGTDAPVDGAKGCGCSGAGALGGAAALAALALRRRRR